MNIFWHTNKQNRYYLLPGSAVTIPVIRANDSPIKIEGSTYNKTTNAYDQLQNSTKWTASLVWESSRGLVTLSETTGKGPLGSFKVKATNASIQGNAVVAIKNASGAILWSWHIWVTTYDGSTQFKNNNGDRTFVFMDRALGATSTTAGELGTCGVYYQWGRKDPFPGAAQNGGYWTIAYDDPIRVYNNLGVIFEIYKAPVLNVIPNNLTNAIRNPDTFYFNASAPYDWFVFDSSSTQDGSLWSGSDRATITAAAKSVFDPCPPGWRVPPWINNYSPFQGMESGGTFDIITNGGFWNNNYFSASGYRRTDTGLINNVSTRGYYWSASPNDIKGSHLGNYSA